MRLNWKEVPRILAIAGSLLLLALPLAAQQQDSSASGSSSSQQSQSSAGNSQQKSQSGSAATPKKDNGQKSAPKPASKSEQNSFPEAQSEKAAQQQQQQESAPSAPAPQTAQPRKSSSTADQNPFPEQQSEKAAEKAQQDQQKGDQDYSSSSSGVKGLNLPAEAKPLAAGAPGNSGFSPDLARKDVKVGNFYLQTGDFKGAYDRFLEATQVNPGSADAVYGLAEAARHLNKREMAIQYYQLYLAALPDGPRAKDARKSLKELGAESKP